jgi:YVTN family beta-propeller protein
MRGEKEGQIMGELLSRADAVRAWLLIATAALAACWIGVPSAAASGSVNSSPVGSHPVGVSSDGTHVWVASQAAGTVTEIDASTGAVVRTIGVGTEPFGVSSDGTHVWVTNLHDNSVSEIDAASGAVVNTIGVGARPGGVSSDGTDVWVTSGTSLTEIEAATGTVVRTIELGLVPTGVSSDGVHVWVSSELANNVSEIDASSGSVVNTISFPGMHPIGVSADGSHVWVALKSGEAVAEIDPSTATVVATVHKVGEGPRAVSSDGTHVWVSDDGSGNVSEIDASTATLINTFQLAKGSFTTWVSSDGTHVWITDFADDTVKEIPTTFTAECEGNAGTIKLSPGLTGTAAVQTVKIKGTLSGCLGENFTAVGYKAALKTSGPVSCSALHEAGEPATGSAKYKWTPKKANGLEGPLSVPLTETLAGAFSSEAPAPPAASWLLTMTGTVTDTFTGGLTCGAKPVKKGTFAGSGVSLLYHHK